LYKQKKENTKADNSQLASTLIFAGGTWVRTGSAFYFASPQPSPKGEGVWAVIKG
jgi:hypothetical protein